jgi:single-strand DNA-binding protein
LFNNCQFVGRLGKDPEAKTTKNGEGMFATFTMAVDKNSKKDAESKPLWLNITAFGKTAEFVTKYLTKGALVLVQGELEVQEYTDKDQNPRQSIKILARDVRSLGSKNQATEGAKAANATATASAGATDEDIPF